MRHTNRLPYTVAILCPLLLCFGVVGHATSIVLIREAQPSVVAIGADGLQLDIVRGRDPQIRSVCKIVLVGSVAATSAGISKIDYDQPLVVDEILESVLKTPGSLAQRAETLDRRLQSALTRAIRLMGSESYEAMLQATHGLLVEVAIAGFEDSTPTLLLRRYTVPETYAPGARPVSVARFRCPGGCPGNIGLYTFGASGRVHEAIRSDFTLRRRLGLIGLIEYVIGLEATAAPDLVRRPIDILTIDGNGTVAWSAGSKSECRVNRATKPTPLRRQ